MSVKRKILVLSLLTVFLIAAPLILLYASGYRYSPKKGRLEKTGILRIDTVPAEATVYLDGRKIRPNTPVSISHLLPEQYRIRMVRSGYLPWRKTLSVESGKTTFVRELVLVPDSLPQLTVGSPITAGSFDHAGNLAAFVKDDGSWEEIRRYDMSTGNLLSIYRFPSGKFERSTLDISPNGDLLLFVGYPDNGEKPTIRVFRTNLPDSGDAEIATWNDDRPVYDWLDTGRTIVFFDGQRLRTTGVDGQQREVTLEDRPQNLLATRNKLWMLTEDKDGIARAVELGLPNLNPSSEHVFELPQPDYRIIQGNERYLLLSGNGPDSGLLIDTQADKKMRLPQFSSALWEKTDDEGRLLAWNDFEIFVIQPSDGRTDLITRLGRPIYDCGWYPSGSMVIFSTDRDIMAIELDARSQRNTYELADFERIGRLTVDPDSRTLRFFGAIGQRQGIYERPL